MIFDSAAIKELFLIVIKRAKERYDFRIENFCLMGNHFHLVIRPAKGECLSAIMRWIMSVFAMAYNRIHGYSGHVWGGRFFSRIISGLRELVAVFEYIDGNPVRAMQVADKYRWRYGGLWHHRHGLRDIVEDSGAWIALSFPERGLPLLP